MKKMMVILCLTLFASKLTFGFTDCDRPVKGVWSSMANNTTSSQVWVAFSDGGGAILKSESDVSAGQMNRFMSLVLLAKTSRKKLRVRYPENDLSCPPPHAVHRDDFSGVWLME